MLFLSKNSPTSLDAMVMIGFIEPPNNRTVVTSDVYVVVYTWNSDSGETIFDGQVSFGSRLELPISKLRVSFSFRTVRSILSVAAPPPTQSPPDTTRSPPPSPIVSIGKQVCIRVVRNLQLRRPY